MFWLPGNLEIWCGRLRFVTVFRRVGVMCVAAVALATLTGCGGSVAAVSPPAAHSPVTLPAVTHEAKAKPFDFGYVRLWLPSSWSTTNAQTLHPSCHPDYLSYHDQIFSPLYPAPFRPCPAAAHGDWVLILPAPKTVPAGATPIKINGITAWASPAKPPGATQYELPSLHTAITVLGSGAHKLLDTLQPSTLAAVLQTHYPTPVPSGWRTVRYHDITARVPSTWPVKAVGNRIPPGGCGDPLPKPPAVFTGNSTGGVTNCGSQPVELVTIPADGLWLHPTIPGALLSEPREPVHLIGGTAQLVYWPGGDGYADAIDLLLTLHGHHIDATIGLGLNPTIAEAIISSLGVTGTFHAEL